jgi:bifunctional non-homologous end joining protein LigD
MELKEYRAKRNFKVTPEPPGKNRPVDQAPLRFVVHKHHASRLHWDLRLELDGVLKSWAVPKGPTLDPQEKRLAVMVEDHPLDYQAFEGIIPEGNYGAGTVMIWDRGDYHALGFADRRSSEEALRKGLDKGHITFILDGNRLRGEFALVKLKKGQENSWLLLKKNDVFADGNLQADTDSSVASGRTMGEIARNVPDLTGIDLTGASEGPMPTRVEPMLATLVDKAFDRPGWLFEIKWDGYRALAEGIGGRVHLRSRHDQDLSEQFKPVIESLEHLPFDVLLDGEIVVVDQAGKASFTLLQEYLRSGRGNLVYYVFDLLYFRGFISFCLSREERYRGHRCQGRTEPLPFGSERQGMAES